MTNGIPLTRGFVVLALVQPFLAEGGSPDLAFREAGLPPPDHIAMDDVIPASSYYQLLDIMALALDDPCFPARAGAAIARSGIPALVEARSGSHSLGECFLRLISIFRNTVTNTHYELTSDGRTAFLRLRGRALVNVRTARVDTLNAAAFLAILADELETPSLEGVMVSIPDPASLPASMLPPSSVARLKEGGVVISFSADWLLRPLRLHWRGEVASIGSAKETGGPAGDIDLLRKAIRNRISTGPVTLSAVAADLGIKPRRLQRMLGERASSFRRELAAEKLDVARTLVMSTISPIGAIAQDCGFASPQALSRAFARAFGKSPSSMRLNEQLE